MDFKIPTSVRPFDEVDTERKIIIITSSQPISSKLYDNLRIFSGSFSKERWSPTELVLEPFPGHDRKDIFLLAITAAYITANHRSIDTFWNIELGTHLQRMSSSIDYQKNFPIDYQNFYMIMSTWIFHHAVLELEKFNPHTNLDARLISTDIVDTRIDLLNQAISKLSYIDADKTVIGKEAVLKNLKELEGYREDLKDAQARVKETNKKINKLRDLITNLIEGYKISKSNVTTADRNQFDTWRYIHKQCQDFTNDLIRFRKLCEVDVDKDVMDRIKEISPV